MAVDLFEDEQRVLDDALKCIENVRNGGEFNFEEFAKITKEYGRMLKQLRRSTKIADRTTIDLHESNLDLKDKVNVDGLTGIYNRRFMEDGLDRVIKTIARCSGYLSVLMLDVDYFKKYNDTYGHGAGDECLKAVAKALEKSISRGDDFVARYGGEEFVIFLPNTGESGALFVTNRIIENVKELNIPHEKSEVSNIVTVSIGVTSSLVNHSQSSTDYIKRADEALYMSKNSGRNRYTYIDF